MAPINGVIRKAFKLALVATSAAMVAGALRADQPADSASPAAKAEVDSALRAPIACENHLDCTPCASRLWGSVEYLNWWLTGDHLPPLVTTGPPSSGGIPGQPGTAVVFGDTRVNDNERSGARVTLGCWLDDCKTCGIGADFFMLERVGDRFFTSSNGDPVLARPFFNTLISAADAEAIAFPRLAAGSVSVGTFSEFSGADLFVRYNLSSSAESRIDFVAGYRFLHLKEGLQVDEQVVSLARPEQVQPDQVPPVGTTLAVMDHFETENWFNGGEVGLQTSWTRGPWSVDAAAMVAIGATERSVNILGRTTITVPGQGSQTFSGGFLALDLNSGHFEDWAFSVVPELRFNVGYQVNDCLRVFAGYTLLFWTDVARPGNQLDLNINPNFLPPVLGGGTPSPFFHLRESDLWVQGFNLGLSINY